jgi:hypothetical protein
MSCRSRSIAAPKHHRPQIEASILTTSVLTRWSSTQAPTAKPCAQESLGHQVLHPTPARRRTAWGSPDEDHAARLLESTSYMKGANLPLTLAKDVPGRHAGKLLHLAELHLAALQPHEAPPNRLLWRVACPPLQQQRPAVAAVRRCVKEWPGDREDWGRPGVTTGGGGRHRSDAFLSFFRC